MYTHYNHFSIKFRTSSFLIKYNWRFTKNISDFNRNITRLSFLIITLVFLHITHSSFSGSLKFSWLPGKKAWIDKKIPIWCQRQDGISCHTMALSDFLPEVPDLYPSWTLAHLVFSRSKLEFPTYISICLYMLRI